MKALVTTLSFICIFLLNSASAQDCPFTYEQGLQVGCSIAQQANADGCYRQNCSNAYQNTVADFAQACPDYVLGVIEGWIICNTPPAWQNNEGGNLPTSTDDLIADDCQFINGHWDCP